MNQLINDVFGDTHITLRCEAGECLHYSLVPGFQVRIAPDTCERAFADPIRDEQRPEKPDNTRTVAISIAAAGLVVVVACLCA
jgi:hypothetical protein